MMLIYLVSFIDNAGKRKLLCYYIKQQCRNTVAQGAWDRRQGAKGRRQGI